MRVCVYVGSSFENWFSREISVYENREKERKKREREGKANWGRENGIVGFGETFKGYF